MKRIFAVIVSLALVSFAFGQKVSGTFKLLEDEGKAKVEVDFSKAFIHGMSEIEFSNYETDWEKDKPEIIGKFIGGLQAGVKSMAVLGNFSSNAILRIEVLTISPKGDYMCDVILLVDGNEVARINNIYGKGGKFGTKLNLIKDGAEHTGEAAGKLISKNRK